MIRAITTLREWCEDLDSLISDGETHLTLIVHPTTEVAYGGWQDDADLEWCREHDVPAYNQRRNGGTIVCSKGNIGVGIILPASRFASFVFVRMARDFTEYLRDLGLNATFEGNDVMIDGYKVASVCGYNIPPDFNMTYEGMQISVNQDMPVIRAVCKKEMVKVPKGLSDYSLTTEIVYAWVKHWLENLLEDTIE